MNLRSSEARDNSLYQSSSQFERFRKEDLPFLQSIVILCWQSWINFAVFPTEDASLRPHRRLVRNPCSVVRLCWMHRVWTYHSPPAWMCYVLWKLMLFTCCNVCMYNIMCMIQKEYFFSHKHAVTFQEVCTKDDALFVVCRIKLKFSK